MKVIVDDNGVQVINFAIKTLIIEKSTIFLHSDMHKYMRAVWKVCGLTLLLQVGTSWRCGDSLFFEVPTLASNALLTIFCPLHENMLQTVDHFKISCIRAPFSRLEKPRNHMGDLDCMVDVLIGFHQSTFSKPNTKFNSHFTLCDFWAFQTIKVAPRQEISK
jgi:hypothetical protein